MRMIMLTWYSNRATMKIKRKELNDFIYTTSINARCKHIQSTRIIVKSHVSWNQFDKYTWLCIVYWFVLVCVSCIGVYWFVYRVLVCIGLCIVYCFVYCVLVCIGLCIVYWFVLVCVSCIGLYWFVYRVLVCIDCFIADSLILFILQYLLGELLSWNLIK